MVYPVLSSDTTSVGQRFFVFAAAVTGGVCVVAPDTSTAATTRASVNVLVG